MGVAEIGLATPANALSGISATAKATRSSAITNFLISSMRIS
jgi:hypothetical protein